MKKNFNYGKEKIYFDIKEENIYKELLPNYPNTLIDENELINLSINNPISSKRLINIVNSGDSVAIITSDITRPLPSYKILPHVIDELISGGIKEKDITVVLAIATHRKHTEEEMIKLVGEETYERVRVIDSDPYQYKSFGKCKNGTPINITDVVAAADRVVCIGNIEYHWFAGYSGGAKAIMPGVSNLEAIKINHSNLVDERAKAGNIIDNPIRNDIDEVGKHFKIDFIVNVVLDENKKVIGVFSGDYIDAHRAGCKFIDEIYGVKIKSKADIVIVSAGGYPKDINIYQAHKSLENAVLAVKNGGIIVLVAACNEGLGNNTFEEWITSFSYNEMKEKIKSDFKIGGHKAAMISKITSKCDVYAVTELNNDEVKKGGFSSFSNLDSALNDAFRVQGSDASVILMPVGGSTLPIVENE